MAVLAVVAIPKFIDLRSDARIAAERSLDGAIRTNSEIWHSHCVTRQPCGSTAGFFYLSHGGKTYLIQNAYPEAGDVVGGDQVDTMLTLGNFDVSLVNNLTTRFGAQGTPGHHDVDLGVLRQTAGLCQRLPRPPCNTPPSAAAT